MEKINFVNNSEPYLSAENLNQMQSNIEDAIKETILYENENGTLANFVLNETSTNYNSIEIMYGCDGYYYSTGKIFSPHGKKIGLLTPSVSETDERVFIYTSDWQIWENQTLFIKASNKYINENNTISSFGTNSYIRIYKVIGYK